MPNGYCGKMMYINLAERTAQIEEPDEAFYRTYLGGWGIIAHELLKRAPRGVDPFAPENPLIFATGVQTGSMAPSSGRHAVGAKSPLTGGFGESDVGGYWGRELKNAGFDAVIITGKSQEPVYLSIHDNVVEFKNASHLWGKVTAEVQSLIRDELGDDEVRVAQCGLAGEKLVRFANIMHDVNRAAGRTGLGAVMGSKNLKAVAVRGTGSVENADPEELEKLRNRFIELKEHWEGLQKYGTSESVAQLQETGYLPTHNFREGRFDGWEKITGERMADEYLVERDTCPGCPIGCKRKVQVKGKYTVDPVYGGPEYETIGAFGSMCEIDDLEAILYANQLCAAYGIDTISTGATIAWLMECFETGLLSPEDAGGIEIQFGDAETMIKLVEMIATREGIGDTLAEGSLRASRTLGKGTEALTVHVKGQELPMSDGRTQFGLGLGYAISPTGADHMHSSHDHWVDSEVPAGFLKLSYGVQTGVMPHNDLSPDKLRWVVYKNTHLVLFNCLGWCQFHHYSIARISEVLQAVTGWNVRTFEVMKAGERALTMARAFNMREGLTAADDVLPKRMSEPLKAAAVDNWKIDPEELKQARSLYYEMMGWNRETGIPTEGKLYELGIGWVVEELAALR
ncbi:aldehyde ferredoxin oxidoreductase family protein [Candidatus Bipolaricaulota bacterium]